MHQRGNVNELNDHGEVDMSRIDLPCGAAGEQSQQRPKAFTPAADSVNDVTFDCGIECRGLLSNARLDLLKMRLN
jgi:hypothetical protein